MKLIIIPGLERAVGKRLFEKLGSMVRTRLGCCCTLGSAVRKVGRAVTKGLGAALVTDDSTGLELGARFGRSRAQFKAVHSACR